jgi:hypothetical protein
MESPYGRHWARSFLIILLYATIVYHSSTKQKGTMESNQIKFIASKFLFLFSIVYNQLEAVKLKRNDSEK